MKPTPQKAKDQIWHIADKHELTDIVIGWGVDYIYQTVLEKIADDIFTGLDELILDTLTELEAV